MPETDIWRVNIVCFDGAHASSIFDFHEVFSVANKLASLSRMPRRITVAFVGTRRRTTVYPGVTLATQPLSLPADLILIPGIEQTREESASKRLPNLRAEIGCVRAGLRRGTWVGAVCGGTFLAAEAATQSHRIATSWWLGPEFAARYPRHTLETHTLAKSKRLITAGAVSSSYAVAVRGLQELAGRRVADLTSRFLLLRAGNPPQASFAIPAALLAGADAAAPITRALRELALGSLRGEPVAAMATHVGLGSRQLLRRVRAETGMRILDWIHHVRVERLRELLARSDRKWTDISSSVGYTDSFHASRRFKSLTGLTPTQFRALHRPHGD